MDRSATLRQLMKKGQTDKSATGFDQLSGKEKAKMLKMLREKKKNAALDEVSNVSLPSSPNNLDSAVQSPAQSKPVKRIGNLSQMAAKSEQKPLQTTSVSSSIANSTLPTGFFDYPDTVFDNDNNNSNSNDETDVSKVNASDNNISPNKSLIPQEETINSTNIDKEIIESSNTNHNSFDNHSVPPIQTMTIQTSTNNSVTSLPIGFFDNIQQDMQIRGIDIKKEIIKKEKKEESELNSFLEEIEEIDDVIQDTNETENEENEYIEKAIQLAYMTKMATLYQEYNPVKRKYDNNINTSINNNKLQKITNEQERMNNIQNINNSEMQTAQVEASNILSTISDSYTIIENSNDKGLEVDVEVEDETEKKMISESYRRQHIQDDVLDAIKKKKEKKRMKKAAADSGEYIPIDFMNWTAKSL